MKELIQQYIDSNKDVLYRDLPMIFGISLKELTNILYGKNFYCVCDNLDLRIVDKSTNLYYFEKRQNKYQEKITKYFMERNEKGLLTLLRKFDTGYYGDDYFDIRNEYDDKYRIISKKDSEGSSLIIDYSSPPDIRCYMNKKLYDNVDKKMKWLDDAFPLDSDKWCLKLLEMDSSL